MSRVGLVTAAFSIAVVGFSVDAHAVQLVNPFGNAPVAARIGGDASGQWIGWQNLNTSACVWQVIGDTTGLNNNYTVNGGSGADSIIVETSTETFCGFPIGLPLYNGHFLDLFGNGGNDNLWSPAAGLDTFLIGGAGNDWLSSGRGSSSMIGDAGNDRIIATGTGSNGFKSGGDGNDCLFITALVDSPIMSCGTGTDLWSGPGSRPADCETTDTHCCGFCL